MPELDRRTALRAAGIGAVASLASSALPANASPLVAPDLLRQTGPSGAPPVLGLHSTFGDDPSRQAVLSWITDSPVRRPRVRLGTPTGGFGHTVDADTTTYLDAASGREILVHHAPAAGLRPDTGYIYQVRQGDARS
ncbi:MAG TPA: fibronectin type III domain-containing protein, partial [Pseudonocardiaceae bacterium]|nr:fibronectin type III domain-containing protein [Pseudonocardiaceae bacterium]